MAGKHSLFGPVDPAADAGYDEGHPARKGFFTDTSDLHRLQGVRGGLQGVERAPRRRLRAARLLLRQHRRAGRQAPSGTSRSSSSPAARRQQTGLAAGAHRRPRHAACRPGRPADARLDGRRGPARCDSADAVTRPEFRWLMSSDVCKHCTHAACLDVCPTGALFRTEFGTVVVQDDICNGCGYCVPACPYGVIDRRGGREGARVGVALKCTLCYDRLGAGQKPACAHACPTESIQFGDLDELRERAQRRRGARCTRPGSPTPGSTATTPTTASAATGRSSCCSTSPRSTGCRRTRSSPPATCRTMCARAGTWPPRPVAGCRRWPPGPGGRVSVLGGPAACAAGRCRGPGVAARGRRHARRRRRGGRGERSMVPEATFTSYYGRPIVKPSPWEADIPAYLFLGGLAAGSSLLGAGADLTGRPTLRRTGRLGALVGITLSWRPWCTTSAGRAGS